VFEEIRARVAAAETRVESHPVTTRFPRRDAVASRGRRPEREHGLIASVARQGDAAIAWLRTRASAARERARPKRRTPPRRVGALQIALFLVAGIATLEAAYIWRTLHGTLPSDAARMPATVAPPTPADAADAVVPTSTVGHEAVRAAAPVTDRGRLIIRSEPSGVPVSVDGKAYGPTPITIQAVVAGEHRIVLRPKGTELRQRVRVEPGATVSLLVPVQSASGSGFVALSSPLELDILENGKLLGTTRAERIMLPAGTHALELVNRALGFKTTQQVRVDPGRETRLPVTLPNGIVHVNASPWAEVWIDGKLSGETPMANLQLPIGDHEFVFRHPRLGDKTVVAAVKPDEVARVTVDLRQK
jgi:hypothetical protein